MNPVGHAFDPPVTKRFIYPVLTIQRFQATFTPVTMLAYVDHVNENEFWGANPRHVLCTGIRAQQQIEDAIKRLERHLPFSLRSLRGRLRIAAAQSRHLLLSNTTDKNVIAFKDGQVLYVGNLNADGTKALIGTRTFGGEDGGFKPYPQSRLRQSQP